ncbi:MAG: UDP-2,3-diacylglucosamine diphosphatase LpxI [Planctomycetota bacterium]
MATGERIGMIAGWGRFPFEVAYALQSNGHQVYCLGIAGHVEKSISRFCSDFQVTGLARMGQHIRFFRRNGVRRVTMAGKIHKILLFQPNFLLRNIPDWKSVKTFFPHFITGTKNRNDDALLTAAVAGYAEGGLEVTPATELVPQLLIEQGQLSGPKLRPSLQKDIEYAWNLAKEMGRLDVGQSVAVKGRAVLAVEAVEGTDECIRRAGMLCSSGGFTVVKVAKPQQDMRFDVPTIGVGTIQSMVQAGGKVLVVEAEKTIIVDQPQVIRVAREYGITLVSIKDGQVENNMLAAA